MIKDKFNLVRKEKLALEIWHILSVKSKNTVNTQVSKNEVNMKSYEAPNFLCST